MREEGVIKTLFRLDLYEIAGELATADGEQLSNQSTVDYTLWSEFLQSNCSIGHQLAVLLLPFELIKC